LDCWLQSSEELPRHIARQSLADKQRRWEPLRSIADQNLAAANDDARLAWLRIRALAVMAAGDQRAAQADWQQIVRKRPADSLARYALALRAANRFAWTEVLEHAGQTTADDAPWQFLQATALAHQQQFDTALEQIGSAIDQGAVSAAAYALRAELQLVSGDLPTAMRDARQAIRLDEDCIDAWFVRGHAYAQQRQWEEAVDALAIVERSSDDIRRWRELILCCLQASRIEQARAIADQRLRIVDKIDHRTHPVLVDVISGTSAVCPSDLGLELTAVTVDHLRYMTSQQSSYAATLALVLYRRGELEEAAKALATRGEQAAPDLREQTVKAMIEFGRGQTARAEQQSQKIREQLEQSETLSWQERAELEILLNQITS
jgi:hypothetical protein